MTHVNQMNITYCQSRLNLEYEANKTIGRLPVMRKMTSALKMIFDIGCILPMSDDKRIAITVVMPTVANFSFIVNLVFISISLMIKFTVEVAFTSMNNLI
jgi:hypothetical protein